MANWEYRVILAEFLDSDGSGRYEWLADGPHVGSTVRGLEAIANAYGADGWELASTLPKGFGDQGTVRVHMFFKRPAS